MPRARTRNNFFKNILKFRGKEPEQLEERPLIDTRTVFEDRRFCVKQNRRQKAQTDMIPETGDRRRHDRRVKQKSNFSTKGDWYLKVSMEVEEHQPE